MLGPHADFQTCAHGQFYRTTQTRSGVIRKRAKAINIHHIPFFSLFLFLHFPKTFALLFRNLFSYLQFQLGNEFLSYQPQWCGFLLFLPFPFLRAFKLSENTPFSVCCLLPSSSSWLVPAQLISLSWLLLLSSTSCSLICVILLPASFGPILLVFLSFQA